MANETLHLRKGLLANLSSAPYVEGALSFTTDEPAIYIDVDNKHLRIGDIKQFDTMTEFEAYVASYDADKLPKTALYYIIGGEGENYTNALLKWTGTTWIQINEKSDFSGDISTLNTKVTTLENGLNQVEADLVAEIARAKAAEEVNAAAAAAAAAAYKAADANLQSQIDALVAEDTAIKDVNTAQSEKITALEDKDTELAQDIIDAESAAKDYTDAQILAAKGDINTTISNLQSTLEAADSALTAKNTSQDEEIAKNAKAVTDLGTALRGEFADADAELKSDITDEYKAYVDGVLQTADAMSFKGVIESADDLPVDDVEAGWTYKVGKNFELNGKMVYVGDLIIANSDQTDNSVDYNDWAHVSSGYEDDHDVHIELVDGDIVLKNAAGVERGSIAIAGDYTDTNGGIKVSLSGSKNEVTGVTDVTVSMEIVWGNF